MLLGRADRGLRAATLPFDFAPVPGATLRVTIGTQPPRFVFPFT
jgi:hypothetical protein